MRARLLLTALLLLSGASGVLAQHRPPERLAPPRVYLGGSFLAAQPVGEFGDFVDNTGFGGSAHAILRLDDAGILGIRLDGDAVGYGREERPVLISPTIGGRIHVDLVTTNTILGAGIGPQLMVPTGRFRPYAYGTVGFSYFTTTSYLEGDLRDTFGTTINHDDTVLSYGGGAGLYIPVSRGRIPVSLDLGVRYRRSPDAEYLREGDIRDNPDGSIAFVPIRSDADLLTFQVGVSVGVRGKERKVED